jgi:hypothetical protein
LGRRKDAGSELSLAHLHFQDRTELRVNEQTLEEGVLLLDLLFLQRSLTGIGV